MYNLPVDERDSDGKIKTVVRAIDDDEPIQARITEATADGSEGPVVIAKDKDGKVLTDSRGFVTLFGPQIELYFEDSATGQRGLRLEFHRTDVKLARGVAFVSEGITQVIQSLIVLDSKAPDGSSGARVATTPTILNVSVPRPKEMPSYGKKPGNENYPPQTPTPIYYPVPVYYPVPAPFYRKCSPFRCCGW